VNNVSLGTLFLGSKINDDDFTERELAILAELQRQAALALWSLELDTAIHTTEELTRLKSKFLANVTHELRTPLNSIINYIGFVVDEDAGPLNPEQQQHLTQALAGAEKLLQIINNILDISKIEAGQMSLRLGQVSLSDLIAETLPQIQPAIERKPVEITTHLAMPLPQIRGDRLRLRQILLNLLANAAKFTEAGKVDLSAHLENGHIVIQVADTGAGIDPLRLPTIFEQFTREDLTDQAEHTGAGLSLPITKALVELHGGQIQITSQPGQGTVVTVKLPAQQF
jgi:signal transduction histidine kinase